MAYCTTDDLTALGYTFQDSDLTYASIICDTASALIDGFCHQTFALDDSDIESTVVHARSNRVKIFPYNLCINSITSISLYRLGDPSNKTYTPLISKMYLRKSYILSVFDALS